MAAKNTNKEPYLVERYLDERPKMRKPVWHIFPNKYPHRRICTGEGCPWCYDARKEKES
jgi:hypothetical protein